MDKKRKIITTILSLSTLAMVSLPFFLVGINNQGINNTEELPIETSEVDNISTTGTYGSTLEMEYYFDDTATLTYNIDLNLSHRHTKIDKSTVIITDGISTIEDVTTKNDWAKRNKTNELSIYRSIDISSLDSTTSWDLLVDIKLSNGETFNIDKKDVIHPTPIIPPEITEIHAEANTTILSGTFTTENTSSYELIGGTITATPINNTNAVPISGFINTLTSSWYIYDLSPGTEYELSLELEYSTPSSSVKTNIYTKIVSTLEDTSSTINNFIIFSYGYDFISFSYEVEDWSKVNSLELYNNGVKFSDVALPPEGDRINNERYSVTIQGLSPETLYNFSLVPNGDLRYSTNLITITTFEEPILNQSYEISSPTVIIENNKVYVVFSFINGLGTGTADKAYITSSAFENTTPISLVEGTNIIEIPSLEFATQYDANLVIENTETLIVDEFSFSFTTNPEEAEIVNPSVDIDDDGSVQIYFVFDKNNNDGTNLTYDWVITDSTGVSVESGTEEFIDGSNIIFPPNFSGLTSSPYTLKLTPSDGSIDQITPIEFSINVEEKVVNVQQIKVISYDDTWATLIIKVDDYDQTINPSTTINFEISSEFDNRTLSNISIDSHGYSIIRLDDLLPETEYTFTSYSSEEGTPTTPITESIITTDYELNNGDVVSFQEGDNIVTSITLHGDINPVFTKVKYSIDGSEFVELQSPEEGWVSGINELEEPLTYVNTIDFIVYAEARPSDLPEVVEDNSYVMPIPHLVGIVVGTGLLFLIFGLTIGYFINYEKTSPKQFNHFRKELTSNKNKGNLK